jgi:fluoroquinolone transport system permease protein
MMRGLLVLAAHDARLQYRYGIYAAYAFVVGFYVLALTVGRSVLPDWAIGFIIYTDPAAVGFFFLGALMMLEKAEGVRAALATSPVTARQYLSGKMVTLNGLAVTACVLLILVHGATQNPVLLLVAVALTSICFVGIGVPIALSFRTVNQYLIGAGAFLTPVIAPAFLALIEPMPVWLGLWPPVAQFRLMLVAFGYASASVADVVLLLAVAIVAAAAAVWFALVFLRRELGK